MAKKIENNSIKGMATGDLKKKLADLQESIRVLKFKAQGSKVKNVKESSTLRKEVARVLTEMNKSNKNK